MGEPPVGALTASLTVQPMFADGEVHSRFDGRYDPLDGYRRHIFGDQIVPEL